ncbi:MAG: hypothetical protein QOF83_261 [Solirubrobacteraceae bacterium]|jgi:hypothetical protein|nr:hypothetical protein [Solirubrobacteraceae bacterium]
MLAESDLDLVRDRCRRVLASNWREGGHVDGGGFGYTCPSPGHYPWQWFWDSCFTAIVWRRFDRARARQELESLLAAQRDDGFIGHTIFWNQPLTGSRRFTYNVTDPDAGMTASIQPPALAWAWRIAVGDPREAAGIRRHHDWLAEHRDLDGDGLLWIVQPDESGLDASPQFDPIWRHRAHGRAGFPLLVRRNRRLGYDLRRIAAAGGPVCLEVLTNVLYNLSRLALGQTSLTPALVDRCWDERRGLFESVGRPAPDRSLPVTIAALAPLALPDLPESIARRVIEEHLLDAGGFWARVPPPSVGLAEPSFTLRDRGRLGQRIYWRGPSWMNAAWLVWIGLARLGYRDRAAEMAGRLGAAVKRFGLREYYSPFNGMGMGAINFGWSTLVLEMLEPDPAVGVGRVMTSEAPCDAPGESGSRRRARDDNRPPLT